MTRLSDTELRDLAPAYAMGTLSLPERAAFEAALAEHAWLREEVEAHRAVLEVLATSERVTPPASLKERTMARIAQQAAASREAAPARDVIDISRARRPWALPAGLAAALAASLVVAVSQSVARSRAESLARSTQDQLGTLERQLADARARLDGATGTLAAILDPEGDLKVVRLTATGATVPGVQFFWNRKAQRGVLRVARLESAPAGKAYQLWIIQDGKPVPMPVFNTGPDGSATLADLPMPANARSVQAIAITLEPQGGSAKPTSAPFLVGAVASE